MTWNNLCMKPFVSHKSGTWYCSLDAHHEGQHIAYVGHDRSRRPAAWTGDEIPRPVGVKPKGKSAAAGVIA